jgi:hypothetical protein
MNILGFFPKLALVEFRTNRIRIKRGPDLTPDAASFLAFVVDLRS